MVEVNVIRGGDDMANALIYKPMTQQMRDYLSNQMESTLASINNVSERFVNTVRGLYNRFNSDEAINRAKLAMYSAGIHFSQDVIYPVRYDTYPSINLTMQSYVMANPEVNALHRKNKCHGFQETYIDAEPNTYGTDRFDYQRVMDGVLQFEPTGEGYFSHYSNNDSVDELSTWEKLSILETWDVVARLIAEGKDPTTTNGEDL